MSNFDSLPKDPFADISEEDEKELGAAWERGGERAVMMAILKKDPELNRAQRRRRARLYSKGKKR